MNKKIALVKLIRNSFFVSNEAKLELLGNVEQMTQKEVDEFGQFLAAEHDFIVQNESTIRTDVGEIIETLANWNPPDKVYVGTGKP